MKDKTGRHLERHLSICFLDNVFLLLSASLAAQLAQSTYKKQPATTAPRSILDETGYCYLNQVTFHAHSLLSSQNICENVLFSILLPNYYPRAVSCRRCWSRLHETMGQRKINQIPENILYRPPDFLFVKTSSFYSEPVSPFCVTPVHAFPKVLTPVI